MAKTFQLDRRRFLAGSGSAVLITSLPQMSHASEADLLRARTELFGDRTIQEGRVTVTLPPIAENGHSVPLTVAVDSPMTETDYVRQIVILSPRNPLPLIGQFHLTPRSGKALVSTRIRMSGTQAIQAIAEMNDGSLYSGSMETVVTLAACVVL
ncbi:MAG: thiosulfate oxidation carrier protein SoxY [Hyphomonadaceae bacterium]|nr:thiosulfate oxidation carrier protein SoxY [Hyphomonadaceae bacterium]